MTDLKQETRAAQLVDMAASCLVTELAVASSEAAKLLLTASGRNLTPGAISEAVKKITPKGGVPYIG